MADNIFKVVAILLVQIALYRILFLEATERIGLAPHERPTCQSASGPLSKINLAQQKDAEFSVHSRDDQLTMKSQVIKSKFDSSDRLRKLRQIMKTSNYDAYLVTLEDEHGSETPSPQDNRLEFISGFTGSRGYALILMDRAVFVTDGRYKIQAEQELDCNWWTISDSGNLIDLIQWLKENTAKGLKLALNARLISLQEYDLLESKLSALESQTILLSQDLVDTVWTSMPEGNSRKPPFNSPILIHPIQYAGSSWQQKLVKLADKMDELNLSNYVITALDEIAWLLNLRGADIPYNPLFKAYVLISKYQTPQLMQQQVLPIDATINSNRWLNMDIDANDPQTTLSAPQKEQQSVRVIDFKQVISVTIYTDLKRITPNLRDYLGVENATIILRTIVDETTGLHKKSSAKIVVNLIDYDLFIRDISEKFSLAGKITGRLAIPIKSNVALHTMAKNYQDRVILFESLIVHMKGIKSVVEVNNMRQAYIRDSLAICMLLAQLDSDISSASSSELSPLNLIASNAKGLDKIPWNEISAAKQLELYRKLMENNKGISFETVSAFGSNSAIIHYGPSEATNRIIDNSSMYLLDSGGQYLDGTTDITRTTHFGQPSDYQRETYTRVLMGSIDMMRLRFPNANLDPTYRVSDIVARRHLYEIGLDYAHGTGHGIGAYGLVHEEPTIIGKHGSSSGNRPTSQSGAPIIYRPQPIEANMMSSVEPGYYKVDHFGIRIEDIVVVKNIVDLESSSLMRMTTAKTKTTSNSSSTAMIDDETADKFLGFEPLSLVPYEPKLIKLHMLSDQQKAWLNQYNRVVRTKLIALIRQLIGMLDKQRKKRQQQQTRAPLTTTTHQLANRLLNATYDDSSATKNTNSTTNVDNNNTNNHITLNGLMDTETLRLALQRAHLWILLKTEPLPLATSATTARSANFGHIKYFDEINLHDELPVSSTQLAARVAPPISRRGNNHLSYSSQQLFDSADDDIGTYRCDQSVNPKSCGLFMMAVNRFHQQQQQHQHQLQYSSIGRNGGASRLASVGQTKTQVIVFISTLTLCQVAAFIMGKTLLLA